MAVGGTGLTYPRDPAETLVPLHLLAPARQPRLPGLRRGRLSARISPRLRGPPRTARDDCRAGARGRRGGRTAAVAGPRGADVAPLARRGGGGVLRQVLLLLRDTLLSGQPSLRSRRQAAHAGGNRALRLLARVGPAPPATDAPRPRGRARDQARPRHLAPRRLHRLAFR